MEDDIKNDQQSSTKDQQTVNTDQAQPAAEEEDVTKVTPSSAEATEGQGVSGKEFPEADAEGQPKAETEETFEAAESKEGEEIKEEKEEVKTEEITEEAKEEPKEVKEEAKVEEKEPSSAKATEGQKEIVLPTIVARTPEEEEEGKLRASVKSTRNWYAVHTYSGYEDRVSENLRQRIESLDMSEKIFDVIVPKEVAYEIKNGKKRKVEKKIFPGYVLVDMIVTEDSWYVVRNTPNVTGFVGFGTTPTPVSEDEVKQIRKRMGVEEPKYKIDLVPGDLVKITDGPFKDFDGTVQEIDEEKGKIKILVSMFGRETPVELDFLQIKKV